MARVLVVDDEPQLLTVLTRSLEREGHQMAVSRTGTDAVSLTESGAPDLVVLDLNLPDIDGIEVLRRVRSWSTVPVLVLSGDSEEARKVAALDEGADDYLLKPFGVEELRARVRALLRRSLSAAGRHVVVAGPLVVDLSQRTATLDGVELRLTPIERRLLQLFVSEPGTLLTHQRLIARVWSARHGDEAIQTLRAHVRSLRGKLGDDTREPRFIQTETRAGYRWVAPTQTGGRADG